MCKRSTRAARHTRSHGHQSSFFLLVQLPEMSPKAVFQLLIAGVCFRRKGIGRMLMYDHRTPPFSPFNSRAKVIAAKILKENKFNSMFHFKMMHAPSSSARKGHSPSAYFAGRIDVCVSTHSVRRFMRRNVTRITTRHSGYP